MIFQFMEKYRVPILIAVLIGMVGFGVWVFVLRWIQGDPNEELQKANAEVVATFVINGERTEVTKGELGFNGSDPKAMEQASANRLAAQIRRKLVESTKPHVSDAQLKALIDKEVRETLTQENDGRYDPQMYRNFCNGYGMTPERFEAALREDIAMAQVMGEINRSTGRITSEEVLAQYIQDFQKTKLTGIFFDTEAFAEQAKLERDENGELTAESVRKLQEYFEGLDEATKRRFHTGGAYLDTEYAGVLFGKKAWKDDAVFNDMFNRVDADSGKSFAQLTEEFTPDDAVISKLKNRLDINRDDYGVEEDADLEEIFPTRKDRLVQEWKILKLLKKIHNELILVMDQGEVPIDLQQVAKDNNLSYFHFNRVTVMDLQKNEDVPGPYPFQLQGVSPGQILNMRSAITPETGPFDNGIVDEPGQHGSIWKLNSKTPNPIPSLVDVRDKVIEDYENKRKEELRDKALEAFEARMDAFLDEKVAEHAATVKSEIETEYQSEIEGLDAETDKDRIAEIRTQKDEEAEERINTEKEKYRAEAFDHAIAEPGEGVVVTQGFFLPEKVKSERPPVAAEATTVEKANSVLRREFRDLLDDPATQKYVDKGTVSEVVTSASFRTMKGIAKVVDKKKPSADEMFLYPNRIAQAEQGVRRSREPKDGEPAPSIWSLENLAKGDFKVSMDKIKAEIEKARDEERRQTESEKKLTEELERRKAERLKQAEDAKQAAMDEAKRLAEAAPANDKPVVVPSNPDEVVPPKKDD